MPDGCFLHFLFHHQLCEMFEGAIISRLPFFRENAAGQLPVLQMMRDAITADAATGTRRVSTGTIFEIFRLFAVHEKKWEMGNGKWEFDILTRFDYTVAVAFFKSEFPAIRRLLRAEF